MQRHKAFAPIAALVVLVVLVVLAMLIAQCDIRHATHNSDPSNILKELLP